MGNSEMHGLDVEGPETEPETGRQTYTVHGVEHDTHFTVKPDSGGSGWDVSIEGLPEPAISHAEPWPTAEAARDAALGVLHAIFELERMQRVDQGLEAPAGADEDESEEVK